MMINRLVPTLLYCFFATSCVHNTELWTVRQSSDGALLGYKMGNGRDAQSQFDKKLEIVANKTCPSGRWKLDNDTLKSEQQSGSYLVPVTSTSNHSGTINDYSAGSYGSANYNGTSQTTTYQTQNYTRTHYWREVELKCLESFVEERKRITPDCEKKNGMACYEVARLFSKEKNQTRRNEYMQLACNYGVKAGCGWVEMDVKNNKDAAVAKFKEGCDLDESVACFSLAYQTLWLNQKEGATITQVSEETVRNASDLARKACNLGLDRGCQMWRGLQNEQEKRLAH